VNEQTEKSPDDGEGGSITVSPLASAQEVTSRQIIRAVRAALRDREVHALNVAVVDDGTIAAINQRYLDKAEPTDVLSFDLRDDPQDGAIEGEIVISAETARRQADDLGIGTDEEILRYVIHGTLHLMGYDDAGSADKRRMGLEEDKILAGLTSASSPGDKGSEAGKDERE